MDAYRTPDTFKVLPRHVAIIMDGNGRWARSRNWARVKGHDKGVTTVRQITEAASALGIEQLTLYAMSVENWQARPRLEIEFLMKLLKTFVIKERETMEKHNIRFTTIGHVEEFPRDVAEAVEETKRQTAHHTGLRLCLALNYGGRREIAEAAKCIAREVRDGKLNPEDVNEETVASRLYQPDMPEPDLLIRTAGELRISNFLLWQVSYSELWITQTLWPDFTPQDFYAALEDFGKRERRYGGLTNLNQVPS
ncbi:MAG: isoprenyl transferase [Planctomycetota bacterium]